MVATFREGGLVAWAEASGKRRTSGRAGGGLRFKACSGGTCPTAGSSPTSPRTRRWWVRALMLAGTTGPLSPVWMALLQFGPDT